MSKSRFKTVQKQKENMQQNVIKSVKENSLLDNISETINFYIIEQLDIETTSLYRSTIPGDKNMDLRKFNVNLLTDVVLGERDSVNLNLMSQKACHFVCTTNDFECTIANPMSIMRHEKEDNLYIKFMIGKCVKNCDLKIWIFMKYTDFLKGPFTTLMEKHKNKINSEFMLQKHKVQALNAWLMHNKKINSDVFVRSIQVYLIPYGGLNENSSPDIVDVEIPIIDLLQYLLDQDLWFYKYGKQVKNWWNYDSAENFYIWGLYEDEKKIIKIKNEEYLVLFSQAIFDPNLLNQKHFDGSQPLRYCAIKCDYSASIKNLMDFHVNVIINSFDSYKKDSSTTYDDSAKNRKVCQNYINLNKVILQLREKQKLIDEIRKISLNMKKIRINFNDNID